LRFFLDVCQDSLLQPVLLSLKELSLDGRIMLHDDYWEFGLWRADFTKFQSDVVQEEA
jgi:hypothetical protein